MFPNQTPIEEELLESFDSAIVSQQSLRAALTLKLHLIILIIPNLVFQKALDLTILNLDLTIQIMDLVTDWILWADPGFSDANSKSWEWTFNF